MAEIDTKLISVEGMPGSGKGAVAHFVSDFLAGIGANTSSYDENDMGHPADYSFHAFMRDDQIRSLLPEEQRQLYSEGTKKHSGIVIPLTKISVNLFGKVLQYKIYDHLDWATEKPVMLEHWQNFAKKALVRSKIYIFNSGILQNPITEMMMRLDLKYAELWDYVFNFYRLTALLSPAVIYLKCTDIRACVEDEARTRNSSWLSGMIDYHTSQGYGKRNGLHGLDGYVDCLEARQRIELKLLGELPIEKLVLVDPFKNWTDAYNKIGDFLKKKHASLVMK